MVASAHKFRLGEVLDPAALSTEGLARLIEKETLKPSILNDVSFKSSPPFKNVFNKEANLSNARVQRKSHY